MRSPRTLRLLAGCAVAASLVTVAGCADKAKPAADAKAGADAAQPQVIPANLARFGGTWERVDNNNASPTGGPGRRAPAPPPPLTPAYQKRFDVLAKALRTGKPLYDIHANCLPYGVPRMMTMPLPFEAYVTPKKIVMVAEDQAPPRMIWVDGRSHPDGVDPSYNGHSVGHWEGDTLVVETVGLRDDVPLNTEGLTPTKNLRVVERFSFENDGVLRDEITAHDPDVFSTPWVVVRRYMRVDYDIQEMVCEENNRNALAADLSPQLLKKSAGK